MRRAIGSILGRIARASSQFSALVRRCVMASVFSEFFRFAALLSLFEQDVYFCGASALFCVATWACR